MASLLCPAVADATPVSDALRAILLRAVLRKLWSRRSVANGSLDDRSVNESPFCQTLNPKP